MTSDPSCIFCKIVRGEIPANKLHEDEHVLAFHDVRPQAPVHLLVVPKQHVATLYDAGAAHEPDEQEGKHRGGEPQADRDHHFRAAELHEEGQQDRGASGHRPAQQRRHKDHQQQQEPAVKRSSQRPPLPALGPAADELSRSPEPERLRGDKQAEDGEENQTGQPSGHHGCLDANGPQP